MQVKINTLGIIGDKVGMAHPMLPSDCGLTA